ncbi:hypothetical protein T265_10058 [Opisthorchis viverrini]|uniref:SNF7 family protein n=2 Tax=Opisthorchis viverrini TaxID=6198 RepID=A0A075A2T4_OPIVI|nr:hypothetical protein T265_10058 [Opisthorchis viverrini]KER21669.1 hypothetical protein T265_10058 [Opisthorchis viverrini]
MPSFGMSPVPSKFKAILQNVQSLNMSLAIPQNHWRLWRISHAAVDAITLTFFQISVLNHQPHLFVQQMADDPPYKPPFVFPDIWEDDDAMFSLMQPIKRPKHVDPETYNRKVDFWSALVLRYTKEQRVLLVSIRALQSVFSRDFVEEGITLSPACLDAVFDKLQAAGQAKPYTEDVSLVYSILKTGINYMLKIPASLAMQYAFGQSLGTDASKVDVDDLFVFEQLAQELIGDFISYFNKTRCHKRLTLRLPAYEYDEFESALAEFFSHEASRDFVRKYSMNSMNLVKVDRVCDASNSWESKIVWVSETLQATVPYDPKNKTALAVLTGLAHLKSIIRRHEVEEQTLLHEIEVRRNVLKKLVAEKKLREAKNLLRRTKVLEQNLEKKQCQLHNLEAMQLELESASDNQQVIHVLKDSGRALQQLTGGDKGLAAVEDAMSEVAESVQESNELSDVIASFGRNTLPVVDDDNLEQELRSLMNPTIRLPSVPSTELNVAKLDEELASLCLGESDVTGASQTSPKSSNSAKIAAAATP